MARAELRLPDETKARWEAEAASEGKSLSEFVRDRVDSNATPDWEDHERRLQRLEEMAGL